MDGPVLALEQAAGFTRAVVYSRQGRPLAAARDEIRCLSRGPGLSTYDPEEIWTSVLATARMALIRARTDAGSLAAIGIANQRDTFVLWERGTGRPVDEAIAADDRRAEARTDALIAAGVSAVVPEHTGLRVDARFPAAKLAWLLDNVPGLRTRAEAGEIAFGTIDTFLLSRFTGGRVHATDASNAARTMLFDIRRQEWDQALLRIFDVPEAMLPRVFDSATYFGAAKASLLGGSGVVSVHAMLTDATARFVGLGCLAPGSAAVIFDRGVGAFVNVGAKPIAADGMLTTLLFRREGTPAYALEGTNDAAADGIAWLDQGLDLAPTPAEFDRLAGTASPETRVRFVPPGLGRQAPYWSADHDGFVDGVTASTSRGDLASAALESVGLVGRDLIEAAGEDGEPTAPLRVDGRAAHSDRLLQFLANITGRVVERGEETDRASLGAARMAGLAAGLWPDIGTLASAWQAEHRFAPALEAAERDRLYALWRQAIGRAFPPAGGRVSRAASGGPRG
ncbi:MAG: glycerol kinase [Bauldia sp.]|nr:glycerol kinase [Bauldia sp.]